MNASASLLGFSFVSITTLRALKLAPSTHIDQLATLVVIIFIASTTFSFLSIRTRKEIRLFETIAEGVFLLGLAAMTVLTVGIEIRIT